MKRTLIVILLVSMIFGAGCASVCVPVYVQESYPQFELNSCMLVIENHSFPMTHSDCRNIKNGAINWLSFDDTASTWKGVDRVCEAPKERS